MALSDTSLLCLSVVGAGVVFFLARFRKAASALPLPPGPPAHPILGNARDVPATHQWVEFTRLGKKYGTTILRYVHHIVVLSSLDAAMDLLDKRGNIYSDRPPFTMMCDLGWIGSLLPYADAWRTQRRIYHHLFHEGTTKSYLDMHTKANLAFLHGLLRTPERFMQHVQNLTTSTILHLAYGMDVKDEDDPWVQRAEAAMANITGAGLPGSYAVDWVYALKYIPAWFPGASFKRFALYSKTLADEFRFAPLEWTREQIRAGKTGTSVAATLLQNGFDNRSLLAETVADVAGTIYVAGSDTTVSVISAFFLCMVLYPAKQRLAQEELDTVLGHGRLPEYADRETLPYVSAVLLEVIRLYPVLPLGLAHRVMVEDEYQGMRIPKGATVIPNVWSILRDEMLYPSPSEFLPERYLDKDGQLDLTSTTDPRILLFGFGRRICPGRHFADAAAWMAVAAVLACFDISPAKDDNDKYVLPTGDIRTGVVTRPMPFDCKITPRSKETGKTILAVAENV
ncbi:cytochrome P450 [Auricularia subglabra TFB-10046 SS5]|nr:cytochrome P450 [Auricularia subglabra TFB-10046 SS5]